VTGGHGGDDDVLRAQVGHPGAGRGRRPPSVTLMLLVGVDDARGAAVELESAEGVDVDRPAETDVAGHPDDAVVC